MRIHALIVLAAALLIAPGDPPTNANDNDLGRLQGTWVAISAEADGRKAPKEAVKGFKIFIKANRIMFTPETDKRESSFKLDVSKRPKEIVITPLDGPHKGQPQHGLYSLEKGCLKLCINNEKDRRPTEFVTTPGDGLRLLVLKRQIP
jgi:uncharacterized protein (TIGR03067 family)